MSDNKSNLPSPIDMTGTLIDIVKNKLIGIGEKGGQKFSDIVDLVVDAVFKVKK